MLTTAEWYNPRRIHPLQIKQSVVGYGKAEKTGTIMVQFWLYLKYPPDDAADAWQLPSVIFIPCMRKAF